MGALHPPINHTETDLRALERDGQTRLWWDRTPVDVFLDTTDFHVQAAQRRQLHDFGGRRIPFLGCSDLAVFKAFFNRTKDWADLEEMIAIGALNVDQTLGVLIRYLGEDDDRVERLRVADRSGALTVFTPATEQTTVFRIGLSPVLSCRGSREAAEARAPSSASVAEDVPTFGQ